MNTLSPAAESPAARPAASRRAAGARAKGVAGGASPAAAAVGRASSPRPLPLAQQAYEDIKGRILSMELRPGQFLNESTLCELLGIGRMPVHQALHRLQAEALVEVIPRKGLVIRSDSLHDILEMLEARLVIEPNMAALAAQRASAEVVVQLEALLAQSRRLRSQRQRASFRVIDRAFHELMCHGAGNQVLAQTLRPLHERSDLIWHLRIMPRDGLVVTQREHEAILQAVARRDPEAARQAMQDHLASLVHRVTAASQAAPNLPHP